MLVTLILAIGQWVTYFGGSEGLPWGPGAWMVSTEDDESTALT